jgi:two-component system OmpR family response regulator
MARILIADDSPEIRQLVSALLVEEGHKIAVAADGTKALELLKSDPPEILILDIMMPAVDGYAVLKEMRDTGLQADTKTMILTARTSESDWVRGYKLGADHYLTKPFGNQEIVDAVGFLLLTSKESLRQRAVQELDRAQLLSRLESLFEDSPAYSRSAPDPYEPPSS